MSDPDPVKRAKERLTRLKSEVARLESFLRTYEELSVDEDSGPSIEINGLRVALTARASPQMFTLDKSSPFKDIERESISILAESDHPLSSEEMLQKVRERGIAIGGNNPRWNMSAKLSRMSEVVTLAGGHGWWLKRRPWPEGGYAPPVNENAG